MIRVGIIGAAGYTGGELIRLLHLHPLVEKWSAYSRSHAGHFIRDVHDDLHWIQNRFTPMEDLSKELPDLLFLALGHGESRAWFETNPDMLDAIENGTVKVIDLTQDFRVPELQNHSETSILHRVSYGFVYGLPELRRESIRTAWKVANPGCFATAMELSLLPFREVVTEDVQVTGITGSTGAGQTPAPTTHYSWRSENVQPYKVLTHQHLKEVTHQLGWVSAQQPSIHFAPWRGPFSRGILVSAFLKWEDSLEKASEMAKGFYADHPFTSVQSEPVHLRQVVGTNHALLSLTVEKGCLVVSTVIDNLLKGASGQAVQNMNLMFGMDESTGLQLKTVR